MGCNSKAKKHLLAQVALARSSRASSASRHSTRPSTPLIGLEDDLSLGPSVPSTPSMLPMPPDSSNVSSDERIEEYSSPMDNHSPDGPEVWNYETVRDIHKNINIPFYFFYSRIYDYYFLLTQFMSRMVLLRCYHFIT